MTPQKKHIDGNNEDAFIDSLHDLALALKLVAFKGKLPYASISTTNDYLYEDYDFSHSAACYICGKYMILINTGYFQTLTPEERLNLLFHELVHYQNDLLHLEDTQKVYSEIHGEDVQFHNDCFRITAEKHGGQCSFDPLLGWIDVELTPGTMEAVKRKLLTIKERQKERSGYGNYYSVSKRRHG